MKLREVAEIMMVRKSKEKIITRESDFAIGTMGGRIGDVEVCEEGEEYGMAYTIVRCKDIDDFNRVCNVLFETDFNDMANGTVMPHVSMKKIAELEV